MVEVGAIIQCIQRIYLTQIRQVGMMRVLSIVAFTKGALRVDSVECLSRVNGYDEGSKCLLVCAVILHHVMVFLILAVSLNHIIE